MSSLTSGLHKPCGHLILSKLNCLFFTFRYMVANRDIQAGEVVFQDRAAAVGPAESNPLCLDCNGKV